MLLEFWGPHCPPCLEKNLPALTKFYEEHQHERDRFEILSICVVSKEEEITTMDQLDGAAAQSFKNCGKANRCHSRS